MKKFVVVLGLLAVAAAIAVALFMGQHSERPAANPALSSDASPPAPENAPAPAPSTAPVAQASSTPGARPLRSAADRPALGPKATVVRKGKEELLPLATTHWRPSQEIVMSRSNDGAVIRHLFFFSSRHSIDGRIEKYKC